MRGCQRFVAVSALAVIPALGVVALMSPSVGAQTKEPVTF